MNVRRAGYQEQVDAKDLLQKKVQRMSVEFPKGMHRSLKVAALNEDRYIRDIIIESVEVWLKTHDYPVRR